MNLVDTCSQVLDQTSDEVIHCINTHLPQVSYDADARKAGDQQVLHMNTPPQ